MDIPQSLVPSMDWDAEDKLAAFKRYRTRMTMYLQAKQVTACNQYNYIVLMMGDEGQTRWDTINLEENELKNPESVWTALEGTFEASYSVWNLRDRLYNDVRQGPNESIDQLHLRICKLVKDASYTTAESETRKKELLFHAVRSFPLREFAQRQKPADLSYDKLLEKAKNHERIIEDLESQRARRGASAENPITVDAMTARGYRQRNGRRGNEGSRPPCNRCAKTHPPRQCPAWSSTCSACGRRGHWARCCREEGGGEYREDHDRRHPHAPRHDFRSSRRTAPLPVDALRLSSVTEEHEAADDSFMSQVFA